MRRRSVLALLAGIPVALAGNSVLATAQQALVALGVSSQFPGGTWSSTGSLSAVNQRGSAAGTLSDALIAGGDNGSGTVTTAAAKFNGATWASTGSLSTAIYSASAAGSSSSAMYSAGRTSAGFAATSQLFNGSTFGTGGTQDALRCQHASAGTGALGIIYGGSSNALNAGGLSSSDIYTGTSWAVGASLSVARRLIAGCGATKNTAIGFGGVNTSGTSQTLTEGYNGTSWSTLAALPVASQYMAAGTSSTSAFAFNGTDTPQAFDGTAWSARGAMSTVRDSGAGCGSSPTALAAGGNNPSTTATCEKYS